MNIEDKSTAISRLVAFNRINALEAQRYDRELRRIAKESPNDVNTFFTTVTKPPKLNPALQQEIKKFKF